MCKIHKYLWGDESGNETVDFIKSRGLNHREFQKFLHEINAEYGDVTYFLMFVGWALEKC